MYRKNNLICQHGFSLIELLIVIAVIGILIAISWFQFNAYTRKTQMESQIRSLYGDLMEARAKAMYEKKELTFNFTANGYTVKADGTIIDTKILSYPITWNNAADVVYSTTGLLKDAAVDGKTICLAQANEATADAVVISMTRIQIGKKTEGAACEAANVTAK